MPLGYAMKNDDKRLIRYQKESLVDKIRPWAEMGLILTIFIVATVGGPLLAIYKFWGITLF